MDKAVAAHMRGDPKKAMYHLDNAKTARYAMSTKDYPKNKDLLDKYKKMTQEVTIQEGHYEDADDHLSKANDADAKGDELAFHFHMADHHDSMSLWHEDKGRSASADKHAEKAEQHHEKAVELSKLREENKDHTPVAPVPDRKYIKGTPEWKAHKEKSKPINGHPTNVKEEQIDEDHVKVGDEVHAGLGQKGGAGFKGTVHKIEGEHVYVKLDSGKYGKYGDRIVKAHHSKVTKEEVEQLDERGANKYKRPTEKGAGLTRAGVMKYRRENPGSKLSTAVTKEPSKLKKGSKAWNRRKSFCARMSGVKGPMKDSKGRPTRKAMSLRRWHCEE